MTTFTPLNIPPPSHVDAQSDLGQHQQSDDVICIHDVSFAYDRRPALQHITLHVKRGSTLGIIGPNGGGKSTLMKLMLGVIKPDSGSITVLGKSPAEACANGALVGYVPQRHVLDWSFPITVRQVVTLGLIGRKGTFGGFSRDQKNQVERTLAAVEMMKHADQPIGGLSGGQQQRVFIARALVNEPQILFLDEPTTGIDQAGQEKFLNLLNELKKQYGLTLVMVSHDLRSVVASCDRVACLSRNLHYHDRPQGLSSDVLFKVFQCDLDAVLDTHSGLHDHSCCNHDHGHSDCTDAPHTHTPLFTPAPFAPPKKN
ncbi:MAG: metal ABC transporter ATP-binding protein [Phycisphaerae bacterium]